MKRRVAIISGLLVAGAVVLSLRRSPQPDVPAARITVVPSRPAAAPQAAVPRPTLPASAAVIPPAAVPVEAGKAISQARVGAGQGGPLATFARFNAWSEKYAAASAAERVAMLQEGKDIALERREVMQDLIEKNPRLAVEQAVPYRLRKVLPSEIISLLEQAISGRANLDVFGAYPQPGQKFDKSVFRKATVEGQTYDAYVYGERLRERSGKGVALFGVALDGALAVAESPVRPIDAVEARDLIAVGKAPIDAVCSVSGLKTSVVDAKLPQATPQQPAQPGQPGQPVVPSVPVAAAAPAATVAIPAALADSVLQTSYGDYGGQILTFCRASHVARFGKTVLSSNFAKLNQVLAEGAPSGSSSGGALPGYTYTQGTKTILYMRLAFPDDTTVPITEDAAYQDLNDLNNFFVRASHGTFSIQAVVTPVLMLPQTKLWYSIPAPDPGSSPATPPKVLGALYAHARAAAAAAGYYTADYDWDCIRFTSVPGAAWGGLGNVGGPGVWLQSSGLSVIAHEFGHNLGLLHANFWDTTPPAAPSGAVESSSQNGHNTGIGTGSSTDYGDFFCTMGIGYPGQYNTYHKWNLGWLPDNAVAMFNGTTNVSSTVRLYAMDAPFVVKDRQQAIRIRRSSDREYWFQYRTEITTNQWLQNGLQVTWSGNAETGGEHGDTDLIDATPNSTLGKTDSALPIGRTFHDPRINLFVTPVSLVGTGSNAFVDVVINLGNFPTNVAPVFNSLTADSLNISPGGTVTFTADATDVNHDVLAYHWDFADLSVSTNLAVISH
ncbi:MAG: hypothetical protein WCS99_15760, partial [Limisphaerales bacterium]